MSKVTSFFGAILTCAVLGLFTADTHACQKPPRQHPPKNKVDRPWERRADDNHDGRVGPREAREFRNNQNNPKVNTPWEDRADTNNNGSVDERERVAWQQNHPNPNNPRAKVNTPWERRADDNHNGRVDPQER